MTKLFHAKPFVIAEVGSNWTNFQEAKDSIQIAKQCGADAVKFQVFSRHGLYGFEKEDCSLEHALPLEWLPQLKEKADACGIEFMCTAFSPELVEAVDPFVEVHKIASSDNTTPQMLEAVKKAGKPILLSCGASSKSDIALALQVLGDANVTLLYCNSAYPSTRHNLFLIEELKTYGRPVGLSDHSLDCIYAPLSAVKHFGAQVIEKHFTAFPQRDTPDRGHSLDPGAFKVMVEYLRGTRDGGLNPTSEEKDMFLRHNRRLIAIKDLKPGDVLKYGDNYGAYRSLEDDSHGLSPFAWGLVEGKQLTKPIGIGKGVAVSDIQ